MTQTIKWLDPDLVEKEPLPVSALGADQASGYTHCPTAWNDDACACPLGDLLRDKVQAA